MIGVLRGTSMMAGPKGIDRSRPREAAAPARPARAAKSEQAPKTDSGDAVVRISAQAADLSRANAAEAVERDERVRQIAESIAADSYEVEPRKVAEAILKHSAPELYQALVAAGEVEE